jgi:hypothetical protein
MNKMLNNLGFAVDGAEASFSNWSTAVAGSLTLALLGRDPQGHHWAGSLAKLESVFECRSLRFSRDNGYAPDVPERRNALPIGLKS